MAMLPFIGYNAGDYFKHWIDLGKKHGAENMPKVYYATVPPHPRWRLRMARLGETLAL